MPILAPFICPLPRYPTILGPLKITLFRHKIAQYVTKTSLKKQLKRDFTEIVLVDVKLIP